MSEGGGVSVGDEVYESLMGTGRDRGVGRWDGL